MSLWTFLSGLFRRDATHLVSRKIGMTGDPAVAGRHYFRIKLSEMFLRRSRDWFKDQYPAVSSLVRCQFGNSPQLELPNIVDSTKVFKPAAGNAIVVKDVLLTPTLPFRGGTVELTAGLRAIMSRNHLTEFIRSLSKFAGLLAAPQLSAALQVADPLAEGIQGLFAAGDGETLLGYIEAFDKDSLKAGHVAVVLATAQQVDPARLSVTDGHLLLAGADLTGFDYMLLRMEVFEERDDWDGLQSIVAPLERAIQNIAAQKPDDAQEALDEAIAAALLAPELTQADRRRVVGQVKERFKQAKEDFATAGLAPSDQAVSLELMMKAAEPAGAAYERGALTWEEAFAPEGS
jgi:hypothetical protein